MKKTVLFFITQLIVTSVFTQQKFLDSISNTFLKDSLNYGVAIGVYNSGKSFYNTKGSKYYKSNNDVTENTLFEIGSVTKIYTTAILASLEIEGALNRDDKLIDFLPKNFSNNKVLSKITLRHLASHTSGIPITAWDDWSELQKDKRFNENNPFDILTKEFIYEKLALVENLTKFEEYHYSNFGFGLLSLILEQKTGLSYHELFYKYIKNPLKLQNVFVDVPKTEIQNLALPHKKGEIVPLIELSDADATGGVTSSIKELIGFLSTLANPRTDHQKDIQSIVFRPQFDDSNLSAIGLGWGIFELEKEKVYWKNGGTYGSGSIVIVCPSLKLAVGLLANSNSTGQLQNYAIQIIQKLIKENKN